MVRNAIQQRDDPINGSQQGRRGVAAVVVVVEVVLASSLWSSSSRWRQWLVVITSAPVPCAHAARPTGWIEIHASKTSLVGMQLNRKTKAWVVRNGRRRDILRIEFNFNWRWWFPNCRLWPLASPRSRGDFRLPLCRLRPRLSRAPRVIFRLPNCRAPMREPRAQFNFKVPTQKEMLPVQEI